MKIDRLMGIIIYLLNNGRTSAQVLAREFEVSSRTIVRDIATLEQAGIPIVSTCGADGGYQILDTYIMDKQLANNRDYSFIYTALLGLASAYDNKDIGRTLNKISLMPQSCSSVALDFSAAHENRDTNEQIRILEKAIEKRKMVEFGYTNSQGEQKAIRTAPVGVVYKWYNWYLIGYHEKYADYCMFKLVRMERLTITDKDIVGQYSLTEALKSCGCSPNVIHVRFFGKSRVKAKCKEYLNGEIVREYENGDFEYCISVPENETFWYGVILSCGGDVKILEPKSVIEKIISTCKEITEQYGGFNDD